MNIHTPQRMPHETWEEYKQRRAESNRINKHTKKALWWPTRFVQHNPKQQQQWKENEVEQTPAE